MLKKVILISIVFHFITGTVFASKTDSAYVNNMRAYFQKYFNDPTDPIVLTAADTLLQMARKHNDTLMVKLALGARLDYYYYGQDENRTDSVITWVNRIKQYAKSINNSELYYWAWSARLVNYYVKLGEYNIALVEAEKMLREAEKSQQMANIAECYFSLANIYSAKGMTRKAQEFMLKEIELFEKFHITRFHISLQYSDAAKIYIDRGEAEKAADLLKKALNQSKSLYHTVTAKLVYVSLYLAENNIPVACETLEECQQMYREEPVLKRHFRYLYSTEIEFYRKTGNYSDALKVCEQQEKELMSKNDAVELNTLINTKADILWEMNKKDEAAALYRKYIEEQNKRKEKDEEIATGEFATLLNLQHLNAEKRELEKISQHKRLQNVRIILFFLAGILCLVIFFLYKQNKLYQKLKRSRDKLDDKNRILIEAESELRKAKEVAEQSSWMKTVFIQNMSHEIRTPLNSIVGFSAVLADLFDNNEESKQYATLIEDNSKLLLKLISDILDISALDNNVEFKRLATDVNNCCYTSIQAIAPIITPGVEIKFTPKCDNLIINSNGERIIQALENLLNNSAKFTFAGSITLDYIVDDKNKQVVFSISDTGIGIPEKDRERIFERFIKLDDFSQGTGLGLSISRIIAGKLGGYLILDKTYTQGTRFLFSVEM